MKVHQFHKGQTVQSLCALATEEETFPARSRFRVIDVIVRHKSNEIKFEGGPVEFAGRVQMKLVSAKPVDMFKSGGKPRKPLNIVEEKKNEDFPFSVITT